MNQTHPRRCRFAAFIAATGLACFAGYSVAEQFEVRGTVGTLRYHGRNSAASETYQGNYWFQLQGAPTNYGKCQKSAEYGYVLTFSGEESGFLTLLLHAQQNHLHVKATLDDSRVNEYGYCRLQYLNVEPNISQQ